jgi:hypothetical protein
LARAATPDLLRVVAAGVTAAAGCMRSIRRSPTR